MEIWKDVKGYGGKYQVSNMGRVRNAIKGTIISSRLNYNGNYRDKADCRSLRPRVDLIQGEGRNAIRKSHYVAVLVANAFIQEHQYPRLCVNHIDCDSTNNRLENLEVTTLSENHRHARAHGLYDNLKNIRRGPESRLKKNYNKRI